MGIVTLTKAETEPEEKAAPPKAQVRITLTQIVIVDADGFMIEDPVTGGYSQPCTNAEEVLQGIVLVTEESIRPVPEALMYDLELFPYHLDDWALVVEDI